MCVRGQRRRAKPDSVIWARRGPSQQSKLTPNRSRTRGVRETWRLMVFSGRCVVSAASGLYPHPRKSCIFVFLLFSRDFRISGDRAPFKGRLHAGRTRLDIVPTKPTSPAPCLASVWPGRSFRSGPLPYRRGPKVRHGWPRVLGSLGESRESPHSLPPFLDGIPILSPRRPANPPSLSAFLSPFSIPHGYCLAESALCLWPR